MVNVKFVGEATNKVDFTPVKERFNAIADMIDSRTGAGNDFLGWLDYSSKLDEKEIDRINKAAKKIRENFDCLVVCGIGGSYLGARAVIDAINGLYPSDDFEIIYLGNTLSAEYTYQVLKHLEKKRFAINCISKSGTTTETAVSFRLLKDQYIKQFGKEALKDGVFATTDKARGALKSEADKEGYECFVIPDDVGGRFSVITPVGLLPIAAAGIDIKAFLKGAIDGEKEYSVKDLDKNPAYYYGALRYLLNTQCHYASEMFISYDYKTR